MELFSDEEEKIVNISKNEDLKDMDEDRERLSEPQNLMMDNPSIIQNNSQEEDLFQSQSKDQMIREKNESSYFKSIVM